MFTNLMITGKAYNFSKKLALVYLPALGAAYFALAGVWHLPDAEQVVGTVTIIDTFLGVVLGISSTNYDATQKDCDGSFMVATDEDGAKRVTLELNDDAQTLIANQTLTFRVKDADPVPPKPVKKAAKAKKAVKK